MSKDLSIVEIKEAAQHLVSNGGPDGYLAELLVQLCDRVQELEINQADDFLSINEELQPLVEYHRRTQPDHK